MVMFAGFLLSLIVVWFLLSPVLHAPVGDAGGQSEGNSTAAHRNLLDQKTRALQVLKDLELDYAMGKVSEEDYNRTKTQLSVELGGILKQMEV
jgi:uncharacterized membrane protein